jgi:hypothetical protein
MDRFLTGGLIVFEIRGFVPQINFEEFGHCFLKFLPVPHDFRQDLRGNIVAPIGLVWVPT